MRTQISPQQELDVLREFVVRLMEITRVGELCWYVAQEVVGQLGFIDCVIYQYEAEDEVLIQAAAMGSGKNPEKREIANKLAIPLRKGITGEAAYNQRAEIVHDAKNDPRFITDVMDAQSEICVPIIHEGKLLGVIDCEDHRRDHFNDRHLKTLTAIASITAAHWMQCKLIDQLRTMRSELQDALRDSEIAQRAQSTFLANVSHELRTPLNAIVGFSSMLSDHADGSLPPETIAEFNQHIHQAGVHLTNIVDDVLDIASLASKKTKVSPLEIGVSTEMSAVVDLVSNKALTQAVDIQWQGLVTEITVLFDPRHLKQILTNLLDNAIKYGGVGKSVILSASLDELDGLRISVQDFGVGISDANQINFFKPFHRDPSALSQNIEGTGLGLSLVKELADANGASIAVSSKSGEGSTFALILPPELVLTHLD